MVAAVDTMAYVNTPPWHGQGVKLDNFPQHWETRTENGLIIPGMRTAAGLDWDPERENVWRRIEATDAIAAHGKAMEIVTAAREQAKKEAAELAPLRRQPKRARKAEEEKLPEITIEAGAPGVYYFSSPDTDLIVRSDTKFQLCHANPSLALIEHSVIGEVIESLLAYKGITVRYDTAGSLNNGKQVWALAQLGDDIMLPGDFSPTKRYIVVMTDHTGKAAFKIIGTNVRVVCWNTYKYAEMTSAEEGQSWTVRHTKGWREQIKKAQEGLALAVTQTDKVIENIGKLDQVKLTREQMEEIIIGYAKERTYRNIRQITKRADVDRMIATLGTAKTTFATTVHNFRALLEKDTNAPLLDTAAKMFHTGVELDGHMRDAKTTSSRFTREMVDTSAMKSYLFKNLLALAG